MEGQGEGLDRGMEALGFALTPSGPLRCLLGTCYLQEEPSRQVLSPQGLDTATRPLSCMPTSHACLRTKACTVCTPFAWPLTSAPGLQRSLWRKEGPASCCWC